MKRKLLTLGVALIFTLSATLSAFAAANPAKIITRNWTNFRGNQSHNAVVSDKLPTSFRQARKTQPSTGRPKQARATETAPSARRFLWMATCILIRAKRSRKWMP